MGPLRPFIGTSSGTRAVVGEENRPDCLETEAPYTSARVDEEILLDRSNEQETDDGTTGTPTDDDTTGGAGALQDYFMRMQYKNNGFFALMDLDDEGSEDTETFTWLFQTWLECMDGIAPKAIITNQDRAMKNIIATVFPETRHRLCLWHILKKVYEKLGSYAAYRSGLKTQLMKCVYDTQTIEEFETCWAEFINTYDLHENPWLKSLYAEREHWEFVDQFDSALKKKIDNENHAELQSFSQVIPCVSRSPIEKKFQELYTNAKFRELQQQVIGVLDLDPSLLTSDGVMKSYLVEDEVRIEEFSKMVTYSVDFNVEDCNAKCSCGLFQMRGILCRHILAVFKSNGIKSLPSRYILDRWRKDIKRRYTLIRSSYNAGDQRPNDSNAGYMTLDTTAVAGSQQVKSPLVVRGK
ncbi:protein FAR1-RELATED SEQUENCE 5-like [Juglans microcarpa x Juglans regia]|uniref:protein FAR1-RELATED SEQUENCE 5-like n=1 Tax=Juglans microcarpa x Juglans regia TaxID=2249226 RepID=UPI001B7F1365|nr:protein FAR1-RELATED SEQUENCE 5-like [Juglans microcarpa x Juglans regia]